MLMSAPFDSASRPIAANSFSGMPSGPCRMTSSSGPLELGEIAGRDDHRGADRHEHVERPGDRQPAEQRPGVRARRVLRLLGDVDRVLEADERVERQGGAGERGAQHRGALLELQGAARLGVAARDRQRGDDDDEQQAAHLDEREADVEPHRLLDAAQVDRRDEREQAERREDDRQVDERSEVVAAEGPRERAGRRDPRHDDRERDEEAEKRVLERAVHVEAGAAGVRVLADELGVRPGRERGHHEGEGEGRPDRTAGLASDLADERVDAAAEDVADDEEQQQAGGDRALERAALRAGGVGGLGGDVGAARHRLVVRDGARETCLADDRVAARTAADSMSCQRVAMPRGRPP